MPKKKKHQEENHKRNKGAILWYDVCTMLLSLMAIVSIQQARWSKGYSLAQNLKNNRAFRKNPPQWEKEKASEWP